MATKWPGQRRNRAKPARVLCYFSTRRMTLSNLEHGLLGHVTDLHPIAAEKCPLADEFDSHRISGVQDAVSAGLVFRRLTQALLAIDDELLLVGTVAWLRSLHDSQAERKVAPREFPDRLLRDAVKALGDFGHLLADIEGKPIHVDAVVARACLRLMEGRQNGVGENAMASVTLQSCLAGGRNEIVACCVLQLLHRGLAFAFTPTHQTGGCGALAGVEDQQGLLCGDLGEPRLPEILADAVTFDALAFREIQVLLEEVILACDRASVPAKEKD